MNGDDFVFICARRKNKAVHGNPCRGRLGRASNELGRGSNDLGRGSKGRSQNLSISKGVTNRPTDTVSYWSRCPRQKKNRHLYRLPVFIVPI